MRNMPKKCQKANSLTSLLFIDLNGPPAASFKLQNYVKSWVLQGHHFSEAAKPAPSPLLSKPRPLWAIWD